MFVLPDNEDCRQCLIANGFDPDPATCDVEIGKMSLNEKQQELQNKYRQRNIEFMDARRDPQQGRLRRDYIREGVYLSMSEQ